MDEETRVGIVLFILPAIVGVIAIALPLILYRKRKRSSLLAVGVANSVFCGLAIFALVGTFVLRGYPSFLPHVVVGAGLLAAIVTIVAGGTRKERA